MRGIPIQGNGPGHDPVAVTVAAVALVIWQQRRAERLAAVMPEQ